LAFWAGNGPNPAFAETCAESAAGDKAGMLYTEGKSQDALPYAHQALEYAEEICGAKSADLLVLLADLAAIHQDLEQYNQAEFYFARIIDIKQAALAPEQTNKPGAGLPNMIIDLDNLAFVYGAQGKFADAGKLFRRVLAIAEHAVGEDHLIVSQALRNLAENYRAEGRFAEANPLLARAALIEAKTRDVIPANWAEKLGVEEAEPKIIVIPDEKSSIDRDETEASLHPRNTARR